MNALQSLFSWQFLLFSLGIFVPVWVIRTIVEYFYPNAVGSKLWEKLILPLMPIGVGAIISYFATSYPYPDNLVSVSARLMVGSVAGLLSGLIYQVVKGMLKNTIQTYISNITTSVTTTTPIVSPLVVSPDSNPLVIPAPPTVTPVVSNITTSTTTTTTVPEGVAPPTNQGMGGNNGPLPGQA